MRSAKKIMFVGIAAAATILIVAVAGDFVGWLGPKLERAAVHTNGQGQSGGGTTGQGTSPRGADSVNLTDSQLAAVKVVPVSEREFPVEKQAVGSIDFNEEMSVQVFTPYPGRIIGLFAKVGDDVKKGQTLFT